MSKSNNNFKSQETLDKVPFRLWIAYLPGNIYYFRCMNDSNNKTNKQIYNGYPDRPPEIAMQKLLKLFNTRKMYIAAAGIYNKGNKTKIPDVILKGNFNNADN